MFLTDQKRSLEVTPSPYCTNVQPFLQRCALLRSRLNDATILKLKQLAEGVTHYIQLECDCLVVPKTPTPHERDAIGTKGSYASEAVIGVLAESLGGIFGYKEQNGFVIHDIFPVKGFERSNTGSNSISNLCFHTDGATHPIVTPDYIILYCLKSDSRVYNSIASLKELLVSMPAPVIEALKQAKYKHKIDDELCVENTRDDIIRPIIETDNRGNPVIRFDGDLVSGVDEFAQQAIEQLKTHIDKVSVKVNNAANSVLILDNKACLHARSAFIPNYDGSDRWVQSAFVSKDRALSGQLIELPCTS